MFDNLIESNPKKRQGGRFGSSTTLSILFHGLLVAAAVKATIAAGEQFKESKLDTTMVFIQPEEKKQEEQKPEVKGGMLDGRALNTKQVKQLATMPSREQMLSELGAGLQSPMAAFVGALNGLLYMFAGALDALKSQREGA